MREVGIDEIFVTAYRVKYLRPPLGHRRRRSIETVYFGLDDLAQIGGEGGQGFEEIFIFHFRRPVKIRMIQNIHLDGYNLLLVQQFLLIFQGRKRYDVDERKKRASHLCRSDIAAPSFLEIQSIQRHHLAH